MIEVRGAEYWMSSGSVNAETACELGIAAEQNKTDNKERRSGAYEQQNRMAIGGLNCRRCGARGIQTLSAALCMALNRRKKKHCQQKPGESEHSTM